MSIQVAKEFLVKIATDAKAAEEAQAAHEESLVGLGKRMGFAFSAADLREAMTAIDELDELRESALEGVAGGRGLPTSGGIKLGIPKISGWRDDSLLW